MIRVNTSAIGTALINLKDKDDIDKVLKDFRFHISSLAVINTSSGTKTTMLYEHWDDEDAVIEVSRHVSKDKRHFNWGWKFL